MRKNFIVKFMTAILLFAMSFTLVFVGDRAIEVEAAGKEQTSEYVFSNADYTAATNVKEEINSFMFDGGFEVQVFHATGAPIRGYTNNLGVMFRSSLSVTVNPSTENNNLISFSVIKTESDVITSTEENAVMTVNNVEITDRFISKDGGYITTYTPIDPTQQMKIKFTGEERRVFSFAITYSVPTVEKVTDGGYESLLAAIEKDYIEEIIITKPIEFNGSDKYIVDAKNKILRAEVTGLDEFGVIQEGSTNTLFYITAGRDVTIKNATVYGGSRAAIVNKGYLYMENVTVSRSGNFTSGNSPDSNFAYAHGGICNYNEFNTSLTSKLVMKNCNISGNVSKYGGAIYNDGGLVILDGCSLTDNRANLRGGAIYCKESSELIINNTVIANNATVTVNSSSAYEGGAIYVNNSDTYIMNSTIVGNATSYYKKDTDPSTFGGGVYIWNGKFYAVNNIITDNYAFNNGVPVGSDIVSDINNMFLYNNIYRGITPAGVTEDSSNNYQLENASSVEEIFASYQTSGNILGDGSTNPIEFEKPILVSMPNGGFCVPTNKNCDLVENGIKTYISYTSEGKGGLYYLSYMKDGVNTLLGDAYDISENEVTTFIDGKERTNSIIGSTNSTGIKYRIIKGINSNGEAGTISGASGFGTSYEYGSLVTVTAIPNEGYEFDYWTDEMGNILSSQSEYTFEALKNITLTPVWVSTVNVGNVAISNLTCDAVVYGGSRSIKFNNLNLEVGSKIEGLYLNDTKVADENLLLLPNISGITDENGQWIATEDVELTANIVPTLGVISTTGYSGTYDGSIHEITVEAISPEDIVYSWYFNGSLIEGANVSTLNVTNVLESGKYYCLLTSIIDGEEVSVRTETIIVDIAAIKVAIPTINNDTYTYNGLEQSVEFTGLQSCMTVTGDKATNAGNYEVIISLDSNYEWQESFNGKYAWTIEKADCDLSHIKFEDLTVIYNGNKQVIEITGTLPEGVEASYTNNEGIDVNTYDAIVEFVSVNYNVEGIKLTATLTINKAKVALPEASTSFVYDGTAKVAVNAHDLYTVEGATATVVGNYEATVTLKDTANYEWAEEFDGKVAWTITKATYDMSSVKFENVTVTYDGVEHVIEITGTLPEGVTVAYTTNKGTVVGTYNAVATFTGDVNYNAIPDMNAVLTINKAKVALPEATTSFVYDGTAKVAVAAHDLYTVEGATATVVGNYEATVALKDTANYEWAQEFNGKVAWAITKATYDMSGITFENVTVTYDGAEHKLVINGTLPAGVTVTYENNVGTNVGVYNAIAKFTYDTANYNTIADMNAVLTINKATYDMSGIKFENITVTYDGAEHIIEIAGILPEGVTVSYITNKGTNADTYNAVATFTYDTANYNTIADMKAVLTINKAKVALPEATTSFVYDGTAKVAVAAHDLYTVEGATATVVGNYEATVALKDTANYEWAQEFNGKVAWTITKATYDMSGVKFENVTVVYNGTEYVIEIAGTLPEGVTVFYTTNKGTVVGTYNAVATFTYDTANYNTIADMNAVLTINKAKVALPEATTSFVYNGTAHTAVASHDLYTVTEGSATNAGSYEAVITLKDTANYEWAETFNGKVAWTIEKATHNMSGVKFENVTVVYDGVEHKVEITGALPEGVTVVYTTNAGTNAGTYNAVATFTYDTANYNTIADMNAVLTINKAKVALPEATTSFVYDGTAKVAVASHDLYTVTEGTATNAGSYEAVITLKDTVNYEWTEAFNGKVAWTITKATYDMSGIKFENLTVVYNGTEYVIEITGTLPAVVTVAYTNNKGTKAGTYNAIAKFTGDANYNAIPDMNAVLTIKTASMSFDTNKNDDKLEDVIVTAPEGIDPNKELYVEMVEMEESDKDFSSYAPKGHRVGIAYDVKLLKDGVSVQPDGTLIIRMLIPEDLKGKNFSIMHIHNDGEEVTILNHEIDGDYVVVETDKLSEFVFVYEMGSLLWIAIVLAVIAMLEGAFLVFMITQKNKFRTKKLAVVYPPFVFGMFVPEWHIVLIIVFAIIVAALAAVDIVYALSFFGFRSKANSETEEEQMIIIEEEVEDPVAEEVIEEPQQAVEEVVETEPVVEESTEDDDEEDVMQVWDEETHSFTIIRITKSFTARLIQSKDEVKDYYDIIKNELLSYKKVKSRISFKYEAFKFGKDNVARLRFRGKTLCLYLALNPADYENTKYKIEDMSAISNSSDVPTMYRINLPRRADYAKELIYDLMKKLGAERMDIDYKEYSKEYPYEDNEALLEKGLIKKSVKVIGSCNSTKTIVNPVNIVKKVSATEVNNLITDEQVVELIEKSTRIANKTKKIIINVDTLSQHFNENETVTLEEIKKRVPNVDKKATFYKVLARGVLDKTLTVDADDFSIEAEKMIIVTGGKVLLSKSK